MKRKRSYTLKRRAERQEETRRRITEATAALHQEIGPAATTISAIAERAGVERYTVYRNFPTETDLFRACQHLFRTANPRPDLRQWAAMADPRERLRRALRETYGYFRATEAMTANILRDAPGIPALASLIQDVPAYYAQARDVLAAGFRPAAKRRPVFHAALGHALDFNTWRSLARRQGLGDEQAADLMELLVNSAL